ASAGRSRPGPSGRLPLRRRAPRGLRRRLSVAALGAVVVCLCALLLPGCQGKKHSTAPKGPARGGTLRIGLSRPSTLDPAQARTVEQLLLARQLFSTLTVYDTGIRAVPSLAASWTASPDQKQWDFKLRPGAAFANGRPISAD